MLYNNDIPYSTGKTLMNEVTIIRMKHLKPKIIWRKP